MSTSLKEVHPSLYQRVRLKAIVFALLGLTLMFSEFTGSLQPQGANSTGIGEFVSYYVLGGIFLVIAAGITYGILRAPQTDTIARNWLRVGCGYAVFWLILLLMAVAEGRYQTSSIVILWGYLCYNLFLIQADPGWGGARIVQEYNKGRGNE